MTQTTPESPKFDNINDDAIMELAHEFDKWLVQWGGVHKPTPIQMASIVLGRLMVFTNHTNTFDTFQDLLAEVVNMRENPPIMSKTEDVKTN